MYKRIMSVLAAVMLSGFTSAYAAGGAVASQDGEELYPDGLENAFSREGTVILTEDFTIANTIRVANTQDGASLDLNGHTLTFSPEADGGDTLLPAIQIVGESKMRIFDSKGGGGITAANKNTVAVQCGEPECGDSELVIDGGNFTAENIILPVLNAKVTINGGNFEGKLIDESEKGSDAVLGVNGGSFSQSAAKYLSDNRIEKLADGKYTVKQLFETDAKAYALSGKALDKVKAAAEKQQLCENIISIKGDMFEISDMKDISYIRAAYQLSGAKNDKLNFDFDAESMENDGSVRFMVLFCNVPDEINIGDAVIWASR